jgi:AcrR family transcriptional regulator
VSETAERLMDLAEAHIRNAGYGRFSFRDLAAEIGIKSASVHHHFPTKATMAAAVARRYGDRFLAAVARRPNESAGDAISVYRLAFREALSRPGLTSGIGTELPINVASRSVSHWGQSGPLANCGQHALFLERAPNPKASGSHARPNPIQPL